MPHRAYFDDEGNMFYNGNMLVKGPETVLEEEGGDDAE
jgi:large subunit ribosomal protein L32